MLTIVLAAAKGGVGKTTLTAGLAGAAALARSDARVGLLDLDPQGSLTRWWNKRRLRQPELFTSSGALLSDLLPSLRTEGLDLLFVDCPPGFSEILDDAVSNADLVLIPAQPSDLDLAAVAPTIATAERTGATYRLILNRAPFRTRLTGMAVAELRGRGPLLWPPLHQRVAVAEAMGSGQTVQETQPSSAAGIELAATWSNVQSVLEGIRHRKTTGRLRLPVVPTREPRA
jgi:chromosome partitioning protein